MVSVYFVDVLIVLLRAEVFHYPALNAAVSGEKAAASTLVIYSSTDLKAFLPLFLLIAFHSLLLLPTVTVVIEASRGRGGAQRQIP